MPKYIYAKTLVSALMMGGALLGGSGGAIADVDGGCPVTLLALQTRLALLQKILRLGHQASEALGKLELMRDGKASGPLLLAKVAYSPCRNRLMGVGIIFFSF